ncbi:MAG: hypoxanthine-guanine phosphoribosyltransferase [Chromatiales bacterium]|jgi:hypoxanthine phosphoribosyltransferase
MDPITGKQAEQVLAEADLLLTEQQIEQAMKIMAQQINSALAGTDPVILCVMNGGLIPAGMLLPQLDFVFKLDYLHATRYREKTSGSSLNWLKYNEVSLKNKNVLIIDDILDEGFTLEAIHDYCEQQGASRVFSAVLAEKKHDRSNGYQADFVGVELEDRYVFGCGMDYKGYLRHLPGIYAVKGM